MTVAATPRKAGPYAGNDVTTLFPFGFKVFTADDVQVVYTGPDGVAVTLVLNSDYSVLLNADQDATPGGTITYPLVGSPLTVGDTLTAIGDLPYAQPTDITNTGRFLPQVIENSLDRAAIQIQQLAEVSSRTLQAAVGTSVTLIFPAPSAGKFIRWRTDLLGLENAEAGTDSMVLQGLLADSTVGTRGAGMIGFNPALTYPGATAGLYLKNLQDIYSTTDAAKGAALLGYKRDAIGAVGRPVQSKLDDWISVKDFGAVGDGVVDDTAAIQAAIAHAVAVAGSFGATVYFPHGDYLYSTLNVNTSFITLLGEGDVRLVKSTTTGNGVVIEGLSGRLFGNRVYGLAFAHKSGSVGVSGADLYIKNAGNVTLENLVVLAFPAKPFKGIYVENCSASHIAEVQISSCADAGFSGVDVGDMHIVSSFSHTNGTYGWFFNNAAGLYAMGANAYSNALSGFHCETTVASPVVSTQSAFQFWTNCISDTNGSHNWGVNNVVESKWIGCWGSTQNNAAADQHGFVYNNCRDITNVGGVALQNNGAGVGVFGNSDRITIDTGTYSSNGKIAGSAIRAGIYLANSGSTTLTGNVARETIYGYQQLALHVAAAGSGLIMSNNDFRGNPSGYTFGANPPKLFQSNNLTDDSLTVASVAGPVLLPQFGDFYVISGNNNPTDFTNKWPGRRVSLLFTGTVTITDGGVFKLASNFVSGGGGDADMLNLVTDGGNWFETGRSVN